MKQDILDHVCTLTGARSARRLERVQSLWRGYGEVVRVALDGGPRPTVVVKLVQPPPGAHPRKLRSYAVEAAFYRHFSLRSRARVARCLGHWTDGARSLFVLEDLHAAGFPAPLRPLTPARRRMGLAWLADFHGSFMGVAPEGLWPVGTYWHLATRPEEHRAMGNLALKAAAAGLDAALNRAQHQTLVHGDAKPANFLRTADDRAVVAVDFQYVGGGAGIKDVAYFLDAHQTVAQRDQDLRFYFDRLRGAMPNTIDGDGVEAEWRALLPVAEQDFARFLDGWGA